MGGCPCRGDTHLIPRLCAECFCTAAIELFVLIFQFCSVRVLIYYLRFSEVESV